jgi:hypothetical protein
MTTATTKVSCAIFAIFCAFLLTGCDPNLTPAQTTAICHAMLGPIYYSSQNPKSGRFAGHILVLDLKQRNQIWQGLHCHVRR